MRIATLARAAWGLVCRLLARLADAAFKQHAADLADQLFEARHEIKLLKSEKAIAEAQIVKLTAWQTCELERKRTETEIEIGRRIVNRPEREE